MNAQTQSGQLAQELDEQVIGWRYDQLLAAGFAPELADQTAGDRRLDLHALIELVERGCTPTLAVRILAPIDEH
jgi:hypothetical protein